MPANNTRQTIIGAVKSALEAITTDGGFQHNVISVDYQLKLFSDLSPEQTPALFIVDSGDEIIDRITESSVEYERAILRLGIVGVLNRTDNLTIVYNQHMADVMLAIQGMSLGANVRYQRYLGNSQPDVSEIGESFAIYVAAMEIGYHYQRANP